MRIGGWGAFEAVDPLAGRVHRDARLVVVARHPAGADAQLEPAGREDVQRGHLLGRHHRVLVVVVQHQRPDPQLARGVGRGGQRRAGRQLIPEVVGDEQGRVAEILGLAGEVGPGGGAGRGAQLDTEAEPARVRHARTLPAGE
jgi:hypothetical protein